LCFVKRKAEKAERADGGKRQKGERLKDQGSRIKDQRSKSKASSKSKVPNPKPFGILILKFGICFDLWILIFGF
jgi:hypothetical protein